MSFMQHRLLVLTSALVGSIACSSSNGGGLSSGQGGVMGSGGTAPGNGGTIASGGLTGNGGTIASGGLTGSGGTIGNGGTSSTGGTISNGGTSNTGGISSTGGTVGTGGTTSAACTGKPGALRGKSSQTIQVGTLSRTFIYYAPTGLDPNVPAPIVIVPHGWTMNGAMMYDITQYSAIADREKFVAIFPDGYGANPWNCGTGICGAGAAVNGTNDDQAFMDALIDFTSQDQCVDANHVFITGFSMGGYFSNETNCVNPKFRAAGPHSGGTHDLSTCSAGHKPIIIFHFKTDSLISYTCGTDARDKWAAHNGCSVTNPNVVTVTGGTCEYYSCPADGQVALCSFDEPASPGYGELVYGHAWSGGSTSGQGAGFAIPQTQSASELGWAFFKKYAW